MAPTPPTESAPLPRTIAGVMRWGRWGADLPPRDYEALVRGCLERDVTCFDHADIYGDYTEEERFGRVLAKAPHLRDDMQLVTKCGIRMVAEARPAHAHKSYDASAAHIRASVEGSLRALRTDRLDVLLLHRPDYLLDADAVARCFEDLRAAGKVRAFGTSNFTTHQFELLRSRFPALVTNQIELSLKQSGALDDGTLDQAQRLGCPPMIWSPLAGGQLFGEGALRSRDSSISRKLADVAHRHGVTADVVAYAWVLAHPSRPSVVTGSARVERIAGAKRAESLALSRAEWYELLEAARGREVA